MRCRAFRGWARWVATTKRNEALVVGMAQRLALHSLGQWRRQHLVRSAVRRIYLWRAFFSWLDRTRRLHDMRAKAWAVGRMLLYGSLTRTFVAWFQYTQVRPDLTCHAMPCSMVAAAI